MPTFSPGQYLVPRWRMMMLPASTASPPNFLTPSRWPAESRPLREEPPAFLWAMEGVSERTLGRSGRGLAGLAGRALGRFGLGRLLAAREVLGAGLEHGERRQVDLAVPGLFLAGPGDAGDAQHRLELAVALGAAIALAADLLEHLDLIALAGLDEGGADRRALDERRADGDVRAFDDHQHFLEGYRGARLTVELLHHQQVAGLDPVLFAAGL